MEGPPSDVVPDRIEREILIAAPIERVWALITEPEGLSSWYAFDGVEVDLRPGGRLIFRWKEHGTFLGRVVRVEPPRQFAFQYASLRPDEEPRPGNSTLVELTLASHGKSTRLVVVESGFASLDLTDALRREHLANSRLGWQGGLSLLEQYAAQCIPREA